ncbi:hypothetical protein [uncultured Brevibacillus sp.]|uniref:hypothetical protein n=1 Tax=uncultured Brevibacillus sp. TaxID=169970 RepID=UPI0025975C10|nr:hypothetical protein [uncultured Brevibacillus sp.]
MGLDVILYNCNKNKIELLVIEEALHRAIFDSSNTWGSYQYLRKIKDYYRTDEYFNEASLRYLINDLINYQALIPHEFIQSYRLLIQKLSDDQVLSVRITGD